MFHNSTRLKYVVPILLLISVSCKVYKQDIMFETSENENISEAVAQANGNYIIKPNDWLKVDLFTNDGEQLIDPNFESVSSGVVNQQFQQRRDQFRFLVQSDGRIKIPVIGTIPVQGLTINEAESVAEQKFDEFYKGSFVKMSFLNKRVTVLGINNVVVPIENENTSLLEVIALSGGIPFGSKAQNVKVIRGDLQNPEIFVIDLSSTEGMKQSIIHLQDGDVVYIEPWRRPWQETLRDASPVISLVTSITTFILVFTRL